MLIVFAVLHAIVAVILFFASAHSRWHGGLWFAGCLISAVAALLFTVLIPVIGTAPTFSTGERTGVATKLSYKGVIWKTNEGSMNMGGLSSLGSVETFEFTVLDPAVIEAIKAAAEKSEKVTVHYNEWLVPPAWYGSSYIVDNVKVNGAWLKGPEK